MAENRTNSVTRFALATLLVVWTVVAPSVCEIVEGQSLALRGHGQIYFVPFGKFPSTVIDQLVTRFQRKFQLSIEALPAVQYARNAVDYNRQQVIAEELILLMKRSFPKLAGDPKTILIGITDNDMYIRGYTWRYAFGFREEGRLGIVSSARMDPANYGKPPDPSLLHTRLRKMIARYIGMMHYQLSPNTNRNSVLYGPILGLDDLDSIGEEF
ncbi:MAG: hypothetical protein ACE5HK_02880 [Candidatus Methylomirabilales bacterium]